MLPGVGDLALGVARVQELAVAHSLPYVAANLECDRELPFPASRVVERGGRKVGIVGVVGNAAKDPACRALEPIAAARAAIDALDADVVVVLSGQKTEEDAALAAAIPRVSLIVNGQERQQLEVPRTLPNGGLLLASGSRGKQLGTLSFTLTPGAARWRDVKVLTQYEDQRQSYIKRRTELDTRIAAAADAPTKDRLQKQADFMGKKIAEIEATVAAEVARTGPTHEVRNSLVDMGEEIQDHPATAALVSAAKMAIAKAETISTVSAVATGPFSGSGACAGCHAEQTAQWASTGHARAWATLVATGSERDRACFSCHVTGAMHPEGPHDPGAVAGLEAVGCEACHGPGKAHVANPVGGTMIAKPDVTVCTECHDGKQDEGRFDAATYFPKIVH